MDEKLMNLYNSGKEAFREGRKGEALKLLTEFVNINQHFADVYDILGIIHHQNGKFNEAIECFKMARKINPRYTEASMNLAVIYMDLGQYEKAKEVYRTVKDLEEKSEEAPKKISDHFARGKLANMHGEVGDIYLSFGLFDDAIGEYRKALDLEPEFVDILNKLGVALSSAEGRLAP